MPRRKSDGPWPAADETLARETNSSDRYRSPDPQGANPRSAIGPGHHRFRHVVATGWLPALPGRDPGRRAHSYLVCRFVRRASWRDGGHVTSLPGWTCVRMKPPSGAVHRTSAVYSRKFRADGRVQGFAVRFPPGAAWEGPVASAVTAAIAAGIRPRQGEADPGSRSFCNVARGGCLCAGPTGRSPCSAGNPAPGSGDHERNAQLPPRR